MIPSSCVTDQGANSERCWGFNTGQAYGWQANVIGLASNIWRYNTSGGLTLLRNQELFYWQDPAGNPYVNVETTIDTTGANPLYSQTAQTVDQFGNVTQSSVWDWSTTAHSNTTGWNRR